MSTVLGFLVLAGLTYFLVVQVIGLVKTVKLRKNKKIENLKKEDDK